MRVLVTGALGKLGHDVARAGERAGHELVLVDLPELDITDEAAVAAMLGELKAAPGGLDGVLNCAAWTDVDGAESSPAQARAVNAGGAGILADAAARAGARLVHVSTDSVLAVSPSRASMCCAGYAQTRWMVAPEPLVSSMTL